MWVALALASPPVAAQWPAYPTKNAPRGADGKPDLNAAALRTAEGKPDLSGVWNYAGVLGFRGGPPPSPPGTPVQATFWNIEAGFKEGLPFTPWAAELARSAWPTTARTTPTPRACRSGPCSCTRTRSRARSSRRKDLIVILYEANAGVRQIFLDGRPLPHDDPQPWWFGYSRGWWDGDTLVVETTDFRDDGWLDVNGAPLTERSEDHRAVPSRHVGQLEIDVTIDDPKAYTKPWTVRVNQRLLPTPS